MKKLLLKYSFYGGDADIDYSGFVVWTQEKFDNFKAVFTELYEKRKDNYGRMLIHCDCDNYLPISVGGYGRNGVEGFFDEFEVTELTNKEYIFFRKFFKKEYENEIGSGSTEPWEWVFETDEWWSKFGKDEEPLNIEEIKEFANTIKHNGDYGYLYINEDERAIIWVGSDGDFNEEVGHSSWEYVGKGFSKFVGEDRVTIYHEGGPDDEDEDWICFGRFGIEVEYPKDY